MLATNGSTSRRASIQRHKPTARSAVISGTGHRKKKFGNENQRSAMRGIDSGVHRLTAPMKASTSSRQIFA